MKTYHITWWNFEIPDDWTDELEGTHHHVYYSPDRVVKLDVHTYQASHRTYFSPKEVLERAFVGHFMELRVEDMSKREEIPFKIEEKGLFVRAFRYMDKNGLYCISLGVFREGRLLILDISSEDEERTNSAAEYFTAVKAFDDEDVEL